MSQPKSSFRLGEALKHVRSVEAHPPHHAHFDVPEQAETPMSGPSSPYTPRFGEKEGHTIAEEDGREAGSNGKKKASSRRRSSSRIRSSEESGPGLPPVIDIEHVPCDDDPREWSYRKKHIVLAMMTIAVVSVTAAIVMLGKVLNCNGSKEGGPGRGRSTTNLSGQRLTCSLDR